MRARYRWGLALLCVVGISIHSQAGAAARPRTPDARATRTAVTEERGVRVPLVFEANDGQWREPR